MSDQLNRTKLENEQIKARVIELENEKADTFWNEDGGMSFDSLEELADYYSEGDNLVMKVLRGMSLTPKEFKFIFDDKNQKWDITPT